MSVANDERHDLARQVGDLRDALPTVDPDGHACFVMGLQAADDLKASLDTACGVELLIRHPVEGEVAGLLQPAVDEGPEQPERTRLEPTRDSRLEQRHLGAGELL